MIERILEYVEPRYLVKKMRGGWESDNKVLFLVCVWERPSNSKSPGDFWPLND